MLKYFTFGNVEAESHEDWGVMKEGKEEGGVQEDSQGPGSGDRAG